MANSKPNTEKFTPNYSIRDRRDSSPTSEVISNRFDVKIDNAIRAFADIPGSFHGVYNPTSFYVRFERDTPTSLQQHLDLFVQYVTIPGKNITSQEFRMYGPVQEIPTGVSYSGDIELRFILDQDFYAYKWIMEWMNSIVGETTSNVSYLNDSKCRLFIAPTVPIGAPKENIVYGYEPGNGDQAPVIFVVEDVWPKTISQIELNTTARNQTVEFTLALSFRKWHYIAYPEANIERQAKELENKNRFNGVKDELQENLDFFKNAFSRESIERTLSLQNQTNPLTQRLLRGPGDATTGYLPAEGTRRGRDRTRDRQGRIIGERPFDRVERPYDEQNAGSDFNPDFLD